MEMSWKNILSFLVYSRMHALLEETREFAVHVLARSQVGAAFVTYLTIIKADQSNTDLLNKCPVWILSL